MSAQKTAIAPMLSVRNGVRAIEFYKAAFGAVELFRIDGDGGAVVAQLSVGGAEFWLADESPDTAPDNLDQHDHHQHLDDIDHDRHHRTRRSLSRLRTPPVPHRPGWREGGE